jgi:hypothetical protein
MGETFETYQLQCIDVIEGFFVFFFSQNNIKFYGILLY